VTVVAVTPRSRRRPGAFAGIHSGQIVATQVAAAGLLAAAGNSGIALAAAAVGAVVLLGMSWLRLRRRWLYQWLGLVTRYAGRRHTLPPGAGAAALLDVVVPGARAVPAEVAGDAAAVIEDGYGLTALLELGDPAAMVAETAAVVPTPASLLPAAEAEGPAIRVRLLVSGVPAPALAAGGSSAATSYRQLTEGRLLGQHRTVLAIQVLRTEGWTEADLRRTLDSAVRRARRRLRTVGVRLLAEGPALAVLADLAHYDGAAPVHEAWHGVHLGGLLQATFRLRRWPALDDATGAQLVPRLLALPASATTVALSIGPRLPGHDEVAVELGIRLAAPTPASLTVAAQALRRLLAAYGASVHRLDGEHLTGLAATLPVGGHSPATGLVYSGHSVTAAGLDTMALPVSGSGLVLGVNRHGEPVSVRLFRSEPTKAMLVGDLRAAQLVTMRALALGAQVVVQTARPYAWEPFVRGVSAPGSVVDLGPPGRPAPTLAVPGAPLRPQLVVLDAGPVPGEAPVPVAPWRTVLVIRDELTPVDQDALGRVDLAVLSPMPAEQAMIASAALGLGAAGEWLTRIAGEMVGVVNRRTVRWALLSPTALERQLIQQQAGDPRYAALQRAPGPH
jgi:type VII secretion protein EccE